MREILFRGKRIDNGEWIEGGVVHQTDWYGNAVDKYFIIDGTYTYDYDIGEPELVIPETVGQYTGLTDKNGKKIFEGDIVSSNKRKTWIGRGKVWFGNGAFWCGEREWAKLLRMVCLEDEQAVVIGNIHDNPELLEEE